jgi:hypothetical protein
MPEQCGCKAIVHLEGPRRVYDVEVQWCSLHAAAKDLLAALEQALLEMTWPKPPNLDDVIDQAHAAIAKARVDPGRVCRVMDLDRAGNKCTVHGWNVTGECFDSERNNTPAPPRDATWWQWLVAP